MRTKGTIHTEAPLELLRLARERTEQPHAPIAHLVRAGLALLAGVNVDDYTPRRGRPRKAAKEIEETQTP